VALNPWSGSIPHHYASLSSNVGKHSAKVFLGCLLSKCASNCAFAWLAIKPTCTTEQWSVVVVRTTNKMDKAKVRLMLESGPTRLAAHLANCARQWQCAFSISHSLSATSTCRYHDFTIRGVQPGSLSWLALAFEGPWRMPDIHPRAVPDFSLSAFFCASARARAILLALDLHREISVVTISDTQAPRGDRKLQGECKAHVAPWTEEPRTRRPKY
jgi:hypothetical protein